MLVGWRVSLEKSNESGCIGSENSRIRVSVSKLKLKDSNRGGKRSPGSWDVCTATVLSIPTTWLPCGSEAAVLGKDM